MEEMSLTTERKINWTTCENLGDFRLHNEIIERFLGGFKTCTSADWMVLDDPQHAVYCPLQFLNIPTHTTKNVVN
jgi:hypothetical protein